MKIADKNPVPIHWLDFRNHHAYRVPTFIKENRTISGYLFRSLNIGHHSAGCFLCFALLFLVTGCRSALTPLPDKGDLNYQALLKWTTRNGVPGAIILVQTPQSTFIGSSGWADVKHKEPMRIDHAFRIASTTKMFLGVVAAQLHAEGRLNTDLVITNYLPVDITRHIQNSDKITVRQLLQHTSGIYEPAGDLRMILAYLMDHKKTVSWPAMRQLKYAYDKPAYFSPGKGYHYSNINFILLGLIIDQVTGHHHSEEIRHRILEPLGLRHTYYELYEPPVGMRAHGYEKPFGCTVDVTGWAPFPGGHCGLVSTVSDLAVFVRAVTGTNSFLNASTRQLIRNQSKTEGAESWYPVYRYDFGMYQQRWVGNDIPLSKAPLFFGHGGATPGYKCEMFHEPSRDITVVFFCSSILARVWNYSRGDELVSKLAGSLFELAVAQTQKLTNSVSP